MNRFLKIGAVSGLVAGFVSGIVFTVFARVALYAGFWEPYGRKIFPYSIEVSILLGAIFGVVLGIIYSKAYSLIPGKGIQKGAYFGLVIYLIHTVRMETLVAAYAWFLDVAAELLSFFFMWVTCGLILGVLYELLGNRYFPTKKEPKIITYDMKSGILPGAIAGLMFGIVVSILIVLPTALGLSKVFLGPTTPSLDFYLSQAGAHIFLNMLWCTIFGAIFAGVYNLVPGKGVMKGLIFGLTVLLITTFQYGVWFGSMSAFHNAYELAFVNFEMPIKGFPAFVIYGLVLGVLYRKPSD